MRYNKLNLHPFKNDSYLPTFNAKLTSLVGDALVCVGEEFGLFGVGRAGAVGRDWMEGGSESYSSSESIDYSYR